MINSSAWWVTGGSTRTGGLTKTGGYRKLDTTEIYTADNGWSFGPKLHYATSNHCFLKIDEDKYFMTAGYDGRRQVS